MPPIPFFIPFDLLINLLLTLVVLWVLATSNNGLNSFWKLSVFLESRNLFSYFYILSTLLEKGFQLSNNVPLFRC